MSLPDGSWRSADPGTPVDDQDTDAYQRGHRDGMAWALEYATLDELRDLVENFEPGRSAGFGKDHSLFTFFHGGERKDAVSVPHYDSPFWRGFAAGAEDALNGLNGLNEPSPPG